MWKHNKTFKDILGIINKTLNVVYEDLDKVYRYNLSKEEKNVFIGSSLQEIEDWLEYIQDLADVTNAEYNQLVNKNSELVDRNGQLVGENKTLLKENQKLRFTIDNLLVEKTELQNQIALLNARNSMLEEVINGREANVNDTLNTLERALANEMFNVSEQLKEALALINENASKIVVSKQVKKGTYAPAKRVDVTDEDIIDLYNKGETPYKIAKRFNMSQQGIIKRLKKLGVYKEGGKNNGKQKTSKTSSICKSRKQGTGTR